MIRINHTSQLDAGNILFFTVLIFASVLINRASRCIDETGVIILCGILSGHSLFNFLIWAVYIPGLHRELLKSINCCIEFLCSSCIERCSPVRLSQQAQLIKNWQLNEVWHCCMFETMHLQLPAPICAQEQPQVHLNSLVEPKPAPAEGAVLNPDPQPETDQELLSGASSKPCDNCDNPLASDSEYCKTCKDWLCAECANKHQKYYHGRTRSRHWMISADQRREDETKAAKAADVPQNLDDKQLRVEVVTLMADGIRQTVISTLRHSPALSSTLQHSSALYSTLHN